MQPQVFRRVETLPARRAHAAALCLLLVIALLDYATGTELSFSVFYVLPIALLTWRFGTATGVVSSIVAATTWYAVDRLSGNVASDPLIPVWNAVVRLLFFAIIAALLVELRYAFQREATLARTDQLTGLDNRRAFEDLAAREMDRSARFGTTLAVAIVDLDDFKDINDRSGHEAGDRALRLVADVFRRDLRIIDLKARLGGDEFVVLLPDVDTVSAEATLERLRQALTSGEPSLGCSVGAVVVGGGDIGVADALRAADASLYRAKAAGKGVVEVVEMATRERLGD